MANSLPNGTFLETMNVILLESFHAVFKELNSWNLLISESGRLVENVSPGHPLHSAVADLQRFYGRELPQPAIQHWTEFLRLVHNDDKKAEDKAEELLDWVVGEIRKRSDGTGNRCLEVRRRNGETIFEMFPFGRPNEGPEAIRRETELAKEWERSPNTDPKEDKRKANVEQIDAPPTPAEEVEWLTVKQQLARPGGNTRITREEANIKARNYLAERKQKTRIRNGELPSQREISDAIGCSTGLVGKLDAYKAVKLQLENKGYIRHQVPKVCTLTKALENTIERDDEELKKLITASNADDRDDRSPLEIDPPDLPGRQPRQYKKL